MRRPVKDDARVILGVASAAFLAAPCGGMRFPGERVVEVTHSGWYILRGVACFFFQFIVLRITVFRRIIPRLAPF